MQAAHPNRTSEQPKEVAWKPRPRRYCAALFAMLMSATIFEGYDITIFHLATPEIARTFHLADPGDRADGDDRAVWRDAVVFRGNSCRSLRSKTDHLHDRTLLHSPHLVHRAFQRRGIVYDLSEFGPDIPCGRVRGRRHDDQRGVSRRTARPRDRGAAHGCVSRRHCRRTYLRNHGGVMVGMAWHVPARDRAAGDDRVFAAPTARDCPLHRAGAGAHRGGRGASRILETDSQLPGAVACRPVPRAPADHGRAMELDRIDRRPDGYLLQPLTPAAIIIGNPTRSRLR